MIAMVKAGVELAFEAMVDSASSKSLRTTKISARAAADREHHRRKRLYEMNVVISIPLSTATTCFLCMRTAAEEFMTTLQPGDLGKSHLRKVR